MTMLRHRMRQPPHRPRQTGAETVEFLLTLILFFIVLFIIIDFCVIVFDKGTVVSAARVGARQGSLFWVNPDTNDPLNGYDPDAFPEANARIKETMIRTAVDVYLTPLLNPGNDSDLDTEFSLTQSVGGVVTETPLAPNDIVGNIDGRQIAVRISLDYAGVTKVPGIAGITVNGLTETLPEARY